MPSFLDCEECRKRREAMIARAREFARRVQNPFGHSLTTEPEQKQEENIVKDD
jgi:hypothetical protein